MPYFEKIPRNGATGYIRPLFEVFSSVLMEVASGFNICLYSSCDLCCKKDVVSLIVTRYCNDVLGPKGTQFHVCDDCLESWFKVKSYTQTGVIYQWNLDGFFCFLHPFAVFFRENPHIPINEVLM